MRLNVKALPARSRVERIALTPLRGDTMAVGRQTTKAAAEVLGMAIGDERSAETFWTEFLRSLDNR